MAVFNISYGLGKYFGWSGVVHCAQTALKARIHVLPALLRFRRRCLGQLFLDALKDLQNFLLPRAPRNGLPARAIYFNRYIAGVVLARCHLQHHVVTPRPSGGPHMEADHFVRFILGLHFVMLRSDRFKGGSKYLARWRENALFDQSGAGGALCSCPQDRNAKSRIADSSTAIFLMNLLVFMSRLL